MYKEQSDPFQYMVEHRKIIMETLDQSSTLKNAWEVLVERLPEIGVITKFNTYKGYVRILKIIDAQLSELNSENTTLKQELGKVRQEKEALEARLGRVRQEKECVEKRLGKVRQKNDDTEKELAKIKEELNSIANQQNGAAVLKSFVVNMPADQGKIDPYVEMPIELSEYEKEGCIPKRVDGWGVQLRGKYYRIFKKINGKVKWIHIGKQWNIEIAREKIRMFDGNINFEVTRIKH